MAMDLNIGSKAKVRPDMNVTPLVDVVLVLLIIFMVLAPVVTKQFFVRLPPPDDKDRELAQVNDPSRPLVLSVGDDGSARVNGTAIERGELALRLERMFNARPDNVLYLDGSDRVPYGSIVSVIDLARRGRAHPVVLLTKPLEPVQAR